jgi:DNA-binding transcriptional regulator YhcF (GntR family)
MNEESIKRQIAEALGLDYEKAKLEPYYQDIKNEIIQPDNVTVTTKYFWTRWAPVLGPVATCLILRLRQYCYYNRLTGEKREYCWPSQTSLAAEVGIKDKKTVQKAILLLESHGFVKREPNYRYDPIQRKKVRSTDTYYISMDEPLVEEDKVQLLIKTAERIVQNKANSLEDMTVSPKGRISPQVDAPVDNPRPKGKISSYEAGENFPRKKYSEEILNNVKTLDDKISSEERVEQLVLLLQEKLGRAGENEKFYELVAKTVPEQLVMQALAAVNDKFQESFDPSKEGIRVSKSAYFTGVLKNLAQREGLQLPLSTSQIKG